MAFAVPVATPGVKLFCSDFLHADADPWTRPVSSRHKMIETLTVFDDVFVPWERVFLSGDTASAGRLALTFVEYHRFTAVSYKLPLVDAFVGLGIALAEANGIARASHVRDKLVALVGYAETVRGMTHLAADRCRVDAPTGIAFPDPLTTNIAKWTFARDYHKAVGARRRTSPAGCWSPARRARTGGRTRSGPTSRSTSSGPHPQPSDWPFSTWRATCSPGSTPATRASSRCTPRAPSKPRS